MRESIEKIKPRNEEKELKSLREEIGVLIEKEKSFKKKGEEFDHRLLMVKLETLTKDDLSIFKKHKEDTWQEGDFITYTDGVTEDLKILEKNTKKGKRQEIFAVSNSRDNFRDFIAEKAKLKFPEKNPE